jgi:hypothetical protein
MFALRRYHSKGQNSVTRLLHYWADVARAWGFQARDFKRTPLTTPSNPQNQLSFAASQ